MVVGGLLTHWRSSLWTGALLAHIGRQARTGAEELAAQQMEQTQFRPFTVTTATGAGMGTQVTPEGAIETTMGLSPQEQLCSINSWVAPVVSLAKQCNPQWTVSSKSLSVCEAAQRPEEERQRLATGRAHGCTRTPWFKFCSVRWRYS